MQTAACRNEPSPRRSTRRNIPAAASSSRKPARIPLETGPSRRSRRKARKASRSVSARSAAAPRRKRSPLRRLRQTPPLPPPPRPNPPRNPLPSQPNRLRRAACGGYSSRSVWSVWLPVSAPASPSGRERKSNTFPSIRKADGSFESSAFFASCTLGGAEPRPYGHNLDILVGAGLCPARLKGKPLRLLPAAKSTSPVRGGKQVIEKP